MRIFSFVVLSVIDAPHNVTTLHISKTHLPNASLNIRELELLLKSLIKEKGRPLCVGVEAQFPLDSLQIY